MKSIKPMYFCSAVPMIMLGGSPTIVAVPPMLDISTYKVLRVVYGWAAAQEGSECGACSTESTCTPQLQHRLHVHATGAASQPAGGRARAPAP